MAANDLLTLAETKDILEVSDTDHDEELRALITAVSVRIDTMCGPVVQRTVTDEIHDGGECHVVLDELYAASATSVVEYLGTTSTTLTAESPGVQPAAAYLLDDVGSGVTFLRRRASGTDRRFPSGRRNVVVTYTAGRVADTTSVPELFKRAAGLFVTHLWRTQAPVWHTPNDFLDDAPTPAVPMFGTPNVVRSLLADEMRPVTVL